MTPTLTTTTVLVSTFEPFGTVAFDAPSSTPLSAVPELISAHFPHLPLHLPSLALSSHSGILDLDDERPIAALLTAQNDHSSLVTLRLAPRLVGGKGGFGSQLRAAGGRMSSQKTSNNDSCRDLSGRRISTVKEAAKMVEYIQSEEDRKKAEKEAQKAKLEALERQLGIEAPSSSSSKGAGPSRPSPPSSSSTPAAVAGKKRRFDDTEYLEQSRDIVDGVKNAVAAGLLKKRKKAKLDAKPAQAAPAASAPSAVAAAVGEAVEKAVESSETPVIAATVAAAVGAAVAAAS